MKTLKYGFYLVVALSLINISLVTPVSAETIRIAEFWADFGSSVNNGLPSTSHILAMKDAGFNVIMFTEVNYGKQMYDLNYAVANPTNNPLKTAIDNIHAIGLKAFIKLNPGRYGATTETVLNVPNFLDSSYEDKMIEHMNYLVSIGINGIELEEPTFSLYQKTQTTDFFRRSRTAIPRPVMFGFNYPANSPATVTNTGFEYALIDSERIFDFMGTQPQGQTDGSFLDSSQLGAYNSWHTMMPNTKIIGGIYGSSANGDNPLVVSNVKQAVTNGWDFKIWPSTSVTPGELAEIKIAMINSTTQIPTPSPTPTPSPIPTPLPTLTPIPTPTPLPTLTPIPTPTTSIINNPDFESGTNPWGKYTDGVATFSLISPGYDGNNSARLAISTIGTNTHIYQGNLNLTPSTRYRLSFAAYSASGADFNVGLIKQVSPYSGYGLSYSPNLVTGWQAFTFEFNTTGFASQVSDGYLYFQAKAADTYYIDNVRLEKVTSSVLPTIITQPIGKIIDVGQTVAFSVAANGPAPLTYQWQKNGSNIAGAISASYTTPPTTIIDNGSTYRVSITNPSGSVMSNVARLSVNSPATLPGITMLPINQIVNDGRNATFNVVATGTPPLAYQWQKNGVNIIGAISASYTNQATLLDNGSTFRVRVTNSAGSVTSNNATLTVLQTISNNLVANPGFESGTTSWTFYTSGTGGFSVVSPGYEGNNAANIILTSSSTNIQLYQAGKVLEPNTHYRLSFAAKSTTGHDMTVKLSKHISPYTAYMPDYSANLGTNWQTFVTEFTTNGLTGIVNDGRLMFWIAPFASPGDIYYIDNVRLEKVENIYDLNNDGIVNIEDLSIVYNHYDEITKYPYPKYDINADGKVDIFDTILVAKNIL